MTEFIVKNVGPINLGQKEFIAKGGQGSVFNKGQIAYKIYEDPSKMLPLGKIQELSELNNPNIIKPENLILNKKNKIVGYTMRFVNGIAICQLFTKSFKQRNNLENDQILNLVKELYELVDFIHQKNVLIVDLNELNFLVDTSFKEVYAIDTDSYQTPSFPATVIMDNIRDRHCKNNQFNENTDWFSWGILSSQLILGVHPYKGGHPKYSNLPLDERLNARMTDNVSIFNKDATVPAICPSFDVIPNGLKQWMKAVFEEGKRIKPPRDFDGQVVFIPIVKQITGSQLFDIKEYATFKEKITDFFACQGEEIIVTNKSIYWNKQILVLPANNFVFTFSPKKNHPCGVYVESNKLKVFDIVNQVEIPLNLAASDVMESDGRIYIRNNNQILELNFFELTNNIQCTVKPVGMVLDLPGSTNVFKGVVFQNLLGRFFISYFPQPGRCLQIGIPELDDYKIIDAKYENKVLVAVGIKRNGQYDRFVFRLNEQNYDVRKVENITFTGLNFTVNDAGVCVLLNEEEQIEIFSNKINSSSIKEVDDPSLNSEMILYHNGVKILFAKDNRLFTFSMKK